LVNRRERSIWWVRVFRDRTDAGNQLAEHLRELDLVADLALGVPRGALPVARPVADALGVPLDIAVAKKLGAPDNPEYAIGAAASDGSVYLDEETIDRLGIDEAYVERERERAAETAREKAETYRQGEPHDVSGKTVVVVDDGVATGATLKACVRMLRERGADRIVVAVPVGSPESLRELEQEADDVIALSEPAVFRAVGQFYDRFGQVSDEEAIDYLRGEA
jgi:predicted phosphoribosyltransferase